MHYTLLLSVTLTWWVLPVASFHSTAFRVLSARQRLDAVASEEEDAKALETFEIPLMDVSSIPDVNDQILLPLPSNNLPDPLTTLHVYGLPLFRPIQESVVELAVANRNPNTGVDALVGLIAKKPAADSWVGAIGCTAQILLYNKSKQEDTTADSKQDSDSQAPPSVALVRGSFRFKVTETVQSIPFPIVRVEELLDDPLDADAPEITLVDQIDEEEEEEDDEEDEDDLDSYQDLTLDELVSRILQGVTAHAKNRLDLASKPSTLLQEEILQQAGPSLAAEKQAAEEMVAIMDILSSALDEIIRDDKKYSAVAFLAAEAMEADNSLRAQLLVTTNTLARLKLVLSLVDSQVALAQARKVAGSIEEAQTQGGQELKVGTPQLPQWARSIRKGLELEYYWNEEWGWSAGTVVEEPLFVVDELILTVQFEADGSIHRLPFSADEKVRWRPPQPPSEKDSDDEID